MIHYLKNCDPANVMNLDTSLFGNQFTNMHLCYIEKTRIKLNIQMMEQVIKESKETPLHLQAIEYDDNSQDVDLISNMPVICKKSCNTFDIVNNQKFIIKSIDFKENIF